MSSSFVAFHEAIRVWETCWALDRIRFYDAWIGVDAPKWDPVDEMWVVPPDAKLVCVCSSRVPFFGGPMDRGQMREIKGARFGN